MKIKLLLVLFLFLSSTYVYPQHIANAMPVDIPLNSSKESAIQKLLNKGYWLYSTSEKEGYKILEYKNRDDYKVRLWSKGNIIPIVSWELYFPYGAELLFNSAEADGIETELEEVYGLEPYATSIIRNNSGSICWKYYHWKGNTIILSPLELIFLSNADAEKRYQKESQEMKREEQKRKEEERLEQERERQKLQREAEKRNKEAKERQRQARIDTLKSNYSSCRFLFASEKSFVSCITQANQNSIDNEIKALLDQKMAEISNIIVLGTEFNNQNDAKANMTSICAIPNSIRKISPTIANYTEDKIMDFVVGRKKINKAFNRAKKKNPDLSYSDFMLLYTKEDKATDGILSTSSASYKIIGGMTTILVILLSYCVKQLK